MYYFCTLCFTKIWKITWHLLSNIFVQIYWSKRFWTSYVSLPFTLDAHFDVISTVICDGETESHFDGETKATCLVETTSHFEGETRAKNEFVLRSRIALVLTSFRHRLRRFCEIATSERRWFETAKRSRISTVKRRRLAWLKRHRISRAKRRRKTNSFCVVASPSFWRRFAID